MVAGHAVGIAAVVCVCVCVCVCVLPKFVNPIIGFAVIRGFYNSVRAARDLPRAAFPPSLHNNKTTNI